MAADLPGTVPGLLRQGSLVRCLPPHAVQRRWPAPDEVCVVRYIPSDADVAEVVDLSGDPFSVPCDLLVLDLMEEAGRDRALRWLAVGVPCPRVHLSFDCPDCQNTGWLRPAHDARWMRDEEWGITAAQSAALLAWSVQSVAAGGRPIKDMLRTWPDYGGSAGKLNEMRDGRPGGGRAFVEVPGSWTGWHLSYQGAPLAGGRGYATLAEGRAWADAAALFHQLALLERSGVLLLPDLPARPFLPENLHV